MFTEILKRLRKIKNPVVTHLSNSICECFGISRERAEALHLFVQNIATDTKYRRNSQQIEALFKIPNLNQAEQLYCLYTLSRRAAEMDMSESVTRQVVKHVNEILREQYGEEIEFKMEKPEKVKKTKEKVVN